MIFGDVARHMGYHQMEEKTTNSKKYKNDYWNNYVHFCHIIEPIITLYHAIETGDIVFFCQKIREIYIIFQVIGA